MPYERPQRRRELDEGRAPQQPGELNYLVTRLIDQYLRDKGALRYAHLNEVIGVLECAKLELYRRLAAPYEDRKIAEHGDAYTAGQE